jgi:hypothetical protein
LTRSWRASSGLNSSVAGMPVARPLRRRRSRRRALSKAPSRQVRPGGYRRHEQQKTSSGTWPFYLASSQRRRAKRWNRKHRFYAFAGLVRCAACGNLAATTTGSYVYYRDVSAIRKQPCPHGGKGVVGARDIERQLKSIS